MRFRISVFLGFISLLLGTSLKAQLSVDRPLKSDLIVNQNVIPFISFDQVDNQKAIEEDALSAKNGKEYNLRFGIAIDVTINVFEEGIETVFPDGSAIYQLGLTSKNAFTINLIFASFDLPSGAYLHIYDPSKNEILGAFTEENESEEHLFATTLISSDSIVLEVFLPNKNSVGSVTLSKVVHGYKEFNKSVQSFGQSGDCNINVSCPEGNIWSNQIRSVALILAGSGNNEICSGSLVNNTKVDGHPFLLSANHCPLNANNVVVFNYQSPTCSPGEDSSFANAINGLNILARSGLSDVLLVELSSSPPNSFNPYYAGWDNTGIRPNKGTCIHHPEGDVKKISLDFKPSISKTYYNVGNDHWMVSKWDVGTTEPVSSGSPLFNEKKLIVGQLHGGDALCEFPDEEDYFGKFSTSWDHFPDSNKQLKYWLDPDNSGSTSLHGYDPLIPKADFDLSVLGIKNLKTEYCGTDTIKPEILMKNIGNQTTNGIQITYYLNNSIVLYESKAVGIAPNAYYTHSSDPIVVKNGFHKLRVEVQLSSADAYPDNNMAETEFSISSSNLIVELVLQTDNDGAESSWEIMSSSGSQLFSGGNYKSVPGGEEIRDTFCLYDGCFSFNFYDDFGDGICCAFGNGYYLMRDLIGGDTIFSNYTFTGSDTSHAFCLGDSCSIRARAEIIEASSTTSQDGSISLEMLSGFPPFTYEWSNGANTSQVNNLDTGSYWVLITDSLNCSDSLFFGIGVGTNINNPIEEETKLSIFPNPSEGSFYITGLPLNIEYDVQLIDVNGKMLRNSKIPSAKKLDKLEYQDLNEGLYLLRISTSMEVIQKRILIVK